MRAFDLWRKAGMPAGHDLDFWLRAERELFEIIKATGAGAATTVDGQRKQRRFAGDRI